MRAAAGLIVILAGWFVTATPVFAQLHVTYNPYAAVDWNADHRCVTQLHDHLYTSEEYYRMCDDAGYNAVCVMHYSGVVGTYQGSAWHERKWPLTNHMPNYASDQAFLSTCQNLKVLIPSAEEVGEHHITSPFLTSYIAKWEPAYYAQREPWHYETNNECLGLINQLGGLAFVAHPWGLPTPDFYFDFTGYTGVEIYSGWAAYNEAIGTTTQALNLRLQQVWDALLLNTSTRIWGIAVNDWYGPTAPEIFTNPDVIDSGKIIVLVHDWTLSAVRQSIERGAFFAVRDIGIVKHQYSRVDNIEIGQGYIMITTPGLVSWICDGVKVAEGDMIALRILPPDARYLRAEIDNAYGTVFTQPFSLSNSDDGIDFEQVVESFVTTLLEQGPGAEDLDQNGDGLLNGADLQAFVDALSQSAIHRKAPPRLCSPVIIDSEICCDDHSPHCNH